VPADEIGDVTGLLRQYRAGDEAASARLIAAAYDELHRVARRCMGHERGNHTLQDTALVNEAFLRLTGGAKIEWQDRAHFYGVAARLMRQILVDYSRQRKAAKRGGGHQVSLDDGLVISEDRIEDVVAMDQVLSRLEAMDPRQGRIVELRFFTGLNVEEIAEVMDISTPTVKREWASAKAWLHRELTGGHVR